MKYVKTFESYLLNEKANVNLSGIDWESGINWEYLSDWLKSEDTEEAKKDPNYTKAWKKLNTTPDKIGVVWAEAVVSWDDTLKQLKKNGVKFYQAMDKGGMSDAVFFKVNESLNEAKTPEVLYDSLYKSGKKGGSTYYAAQGPDGFYQVGSKSAILKFVDKWKSEIKGLKGVEVYDHSIQNDI